MKTRLMTLTTYCIQCMLWSLDEPEALKSTSLTLRGSPSYQPSE